MKYGILFDLDGTLWDSSDAVAQSWCAVLDGRNDVAIRPNGGDLRAQMGRTLPDIACAFFPELPEKEANALITLCCEEECRYLREHPAPLYDGIEPVFEELSQDCKICIVSNCQEDYIEAFLEGHPELAPYVSDTENAGRTGRPKGDNIALVCARNGFDRAVYVGDTVWDAEAARLGGVPFLHAAYGFGLVPGAPCVRTPAELPNTVRKLLR